MKILNEIFLHSCSLWNRVCISHSTSQFQLATFQVLSSHMWVMSDRQQRCWTHIFCLWTCQPHSGLWALCTHFTWRVLSLTHHLHTSLATSCLFRSQLEITSSRKPPLPPHLKYSCPLAYYRNEFQSILIIHGSHHWLVLPLIKA